MEGQEAIQQQPQGQQEGGQTGQVQPQIDVASLQATLQQTLKDSVAELARSQQPASPPPPPPVQQVDPVGQVLAPYMQPIYQQAQMAHDASVFYATNPNAAQHSTKIEELARQYPTTPRAQLWQYLKGDESYINAEVERRITAQKEAAQRAAEGGAVGIGGYIQRAPGQTPDPRTMTPEQLQQALDGISF